MNPDKKTPRSDASPGVVACKSRITHLICSRGLQPGDRLPSQQELRTLLNVSNNVLTPAMRALIADGVISRKTRVGTVVTDLAPLAHMPLSLGIATLAAPDHGPAAFFANLHHRLVVALSRENARCRTYVRVEHPAWPHHRLADFPGLAEDVGAGELDGLIMLTNLCPDEWRETTSSGTAVCHVGHWSDAPCGAVIDVSRLMREAEAALVEAGCRRLGVLGLRHRQGRASGMAVPLHVGGELLTFGDGHGVSNGQRAARALLRRSEADRPDGLIIPDDYAAAGLAEVLARTGGYRPRIAALTNRQLPLSYALPVMQWELDLNELVARGVELIRGRFLGRVPPDRVERVAPELESKELFAKA